MEDLPSRLSGSGSRISTRGRRRRPRKGPGESETEGKDIAASEESRKSSHLMQVYGEGRRKRMKGDGRMTRSDGESDGDGLDQLLDPV